MQYLARILRDQPFPNRCPFIRDGDRPRFTLQPPDKQNNQTRPKSGDQNNRANKSYRVAPEHGWIRSQEYFFRDLFLRNYPTAIGARSGLIGYLLVAFRTIHQSHFLASPSNPHMNGKHIGCATCFVSANDYQYHVRHKIKHNNDNLHGTEETIDRPIQCLTGNPEPPTVHSIYPINCRCALFLRVCFRQGFGRWYIAFLIKDINGFCDRLIQEWACFFRQEWCQWRRTLSYENVLIMSSKDLRKRIFLDTM